MVYQELGNGVGESLLQSSLKLSIQIYTQSKAAPRLADDRESDQIRPKIEQFWDF